MLLDSHNFDNNNKDKIKHLFNEFSQEIRKIFVFYMDFEKSLYNQVNKKLMKMKLYEKANPQQVALELEKLNLILKLIITFMDFLQLNLIGINKALEKFDSCLKDTYGDLSDLFIKSVSGSATSDLGYMIRLKIVNESSVLINLLKKTLVKSNGHVSRTITSNTMISLKENGEDTNIFNFSEGEADRESKITESVNLNNDTNSKKLVSQLSTLELNNILLDNKISEFKSLVRDLETISVASDEKEKHFETELEFFKRITKKKNTIKVRHSVKISQEEKGLLKEKPISSPYSKENKVNLILSLAHTFVYMTLFTFAQPTCQEYFRSIGRPIELGFIVLSATPLAMLISTIIFSRYTLFAYKIPMIITVLCHIVGTFLYGFANHYESFTMMFIGRFILGMGCGRIINRKYLISYIPKSEATAFSLYYVLVSVVGGAMGPGIAFILSYFSDFSLGVMNFNQFTYPGYVGCILAILYLIPLTIYYTDPLKTKGFSTYSEEYKQFHEEHPHSRLISMNSIHTEIEGTDEEKRNQSIHLSETLLDLNSKLTSINKEINTKDLYQKYIESEVSQSFSQIKLGFTILILVLISERIAAEALMITAAPTLKKHFESNKVAKIFLTLMKLSNLPIGLGFKALIARYDEKRAYFAVLAITLFSNIGLCYLINDSMIQYSFFFLMNMNFTHLLETMASTLLIKLYSKSMEESFYNQGFVITFTTTFGRLVGSFINFPLVAIFGENLLSESAFGFCTILLCILLVLSLIYRRELRVKAISRLNK